MSRLSIPISPELEPFRDDLEFFFSTMVRKLHTNRHKGDARNLDIRAMLTAAQVEIVEAQKALHTEGQFEFAVECADAANFLFLASRSAWHMTREEYVRLRNQAREQKTAVEPETVIRTSLVGDALHPTPERGGAQLPCGADFNMASVAGHAFNLRRDGG